MTSDSSIRNPGVFIKLTLLLMALFTGSQSYSLEQPEYEVLHQEGRIEYRLYQPYIVAETEVMNARSYGRASNEGFMRLFRYITGDNTGQTEIAMTTPVKQERGSEEIAMTAPVQRGEVGGGWRVAFMLPGKYSLETAPTPDDPRIRLRQIPGKLMAVIRYSGRWTERNLNRYQARLRESIEAAGINILSEPLSAAYNPPFMPPFMRRNEIMFEVSGIPAEIILADEN